MENTTKTIQTVICKKNPAKNVLAKKKTLLTDAILLLPCQTQERRRTKIKTATGYLVFEDLS